ncbi:MAG: GEVED domain-containing protein [Anaerolineae bacterium]
MKRAFAISAGLAALALFLGLLVGMWSAPAAAQAPVAEQPAPGCQSIYLPIIYKSAAPPPRLECPGAKVDVVFAMDTSPSMDDEFDALCTNIAAVVADLQAVGLTVNHRILGITAPRLCATDSVLNFLTMQGQPVTVNHEEDWGPAVVDLAGGYPWQPGFIRLIIPMSDEPPQDGEPLNDPGDDRDAINAAISAAQANNVIVSPVLGTVDTVRWPDLEALAKDLADATGGRFFLSSEPAADLAAGIADLIQAAACGSVSVTKTQTSPSPVHVGDTVTFDVVIANTGGTTVNILPLEDLFDWRYLAFKSANPPPDAVVGGLLEWEDLTGTTPTGLGGDLSPGQAFTVTLAFEAVGCPPDQVITNKAKVSDARDNKGNVLLDTSSTVGVHIVCPQIAITKAVTDPASGAARVGDSVTFTITIENTGNKTITTLPLTDTFSDSLAFVSASIPPDTTDVGTLSWSNLGPLGPGESLALTLNFTVISCPGDQLAVNTATVSGAQAEHACQLYDVPDVSASATLEIPCPDLRVTKDLIDPASGVIGLGQTATFEITVHNPGNKTLTVVPLNDIFDLRYLEFVHASVAPNAVVDGHVEWDDLTVAKGDIAPGGAITLTATFRAVGCPPAPDPTTVNKVEAEDVIAIHKGRDYDVPRASDTASVTIACPEVEVTKTLEPLECDLAGVGDVVTFTINIKNVGNTTITELPMEDRYEVECMTFHSASPSPDSVDTANGVLTWNDLTGPSPHGFGVDLAPGDTFTVQVSFTATASTQAQLPPLCDDEVLVSGATDEYGFVAPDVSGGDGVEIADADLFITKTQTAPVLNYPLPAAYPGSLVTYTLTYGNNGPDPATFVAITDVIPAGTVFVDDTLCGHVNTGCFLGDLPAGFSDTFELTILVPSGTVPGTVLTDEAWIESGHTPTGPRCGIPDSNPDNNRATFDTIVVAEFGDAPDPFTAPGKYPTQRENNGAYHEDFTKEWLGLGVSPEWDAVDPTDPDGEPNLNPYDTDGFDDGVIVESDYRCLGNGRLRFRVTTLDPASERYGPEPERLLYLRAWIDSDRDGVWTGPLLDWSCAPGLVCSDGSVWPVGVPDHLVTKHFVVPIVPNGSHLWVRARLSYGAPTEPMGMAQFGEVEDHVLVVRCTLSPEE